MQMTLQHSLKMVHQVINLSDQNQRDIDGPLLQDVKSHDTISANRYCQMLRKLITKIKNKHQGKLTDGITMLHNNVRPLVLYRVQDQLNAK